MSKETEAIGNDMHQLATDARALVTATAGRAGEKAEAAREQLNVTLERMKQIASDVRGQAAQCVKATEESVRAHPYQALLIAAGAGMLAGWLMSRRCAKASCKKNNPEE